MLIAAMAPYHPYIASMNKRREGNTIREYVRLNMHATFTPLVLSTTGGMGRAATFYRRLASMLAKKKRYLRLGTEYDAD